MAMKQAIEIQEQTPNDRVKKSDLPKLVPALHGVTAQWNQFGIALHVNFDDIAQIKREGASKELTDKMTDVLQWYINSKEELKKEDIVKALRDIGNNDLASRVDKSIQRLVKNDNLINSLLDEHCLKEETARWRRFGLQLGVPHYELEKIDERKSTADCMEKLLAVWIQKKEEKATFTEIKRACKSVGNEALAEDLDEILGREEEIDHCCEFCFKLNLLCFVGECLTGRDNIRIKGKESRGTTDK